MSFATRRSPAAPRRPVSRFARDERGNVAVLFGFAVVAVFGIGGMALDYGRASAVRADLQSAADSAVLAAKGNGPDEAAVVRARAEAFVAANAQRLHGVTLSDVEASPTSDGYRVRLAADVPTTIARVLGVETIPVTVTSEARSATEDLEIALVLDNTGSMSGFMDDLKDGARDLVNQVFANAGASSAVRMAVVPYAGGVNIGNGARQMAWMDVNGDAQHHGGSYEWFYFGYEPGCSYTPGSPPPSPGSGTYGWLADPIGKLAGLARELLGIAPAAAAVAGDVPAPFNFADPCWIAAPSKVNHFDLFAMIPNAPWKGCVEARAEPYDVTDEPPSAGDPDTLFVPWFWKDEPDNATLAAQGVTWTSSNDYLPDRLDLRDNLPDHNGNVPGRFTDPWVGWGFNNVLKYTGADGIGIDESGPDTKGPNKACPDPILPLSADRDEVVATIDSLSHWNGSGTNTAEGVAWGWRVLSPSEPFDEGAAYGEARKVMVLMTDGVNNVDPAPHDSMSDYSAYGFLQQWGASRVAEQTYEGFKEHADQRMSEVCTNAKAAGVTIYTVAFNVSNQTTLDLLSNCASQPPYAYTADTADELIEAFRLIAGSLSELRLSR